MNAFVKIVLLFVFCVSTLSWIYGGGRTQRSTEAPELSPRSTQQQNVEDGDDSTIDSTITTRGDDNSESAFLAQGLWDFLLLPYDQENLQLTINSQIQKGFKPTGMHVVPGESIALLFSAIPLDTSRWALSSIEPLDDLNRIFSEFLINGWLPVDISLGVEEMYALFIPSDVQIRSWRVLTINEQETIEDTLNSFSNLVSEQFRQQFYLFGITALNNQYHLLFLNTEIPPLGSRVVFNAFPNDGVSPFIGIDRRVFLGALPVGLAVTEDWFIVPFYE